MLSMNTEVVLLMITLSHNILENIKIDTAKRNAKDCHSIMVAIQWPSNFTTIYGSSTAPDKTLPNERRLTNCDEVANRPP